MTLLGRISARWQEMSDLPLLTGPTGSLFIRDLLSQDTEWINRVRPGDVVSVIGDFDAPSIAALLHLFERGAVVVPLTVNTSNDHPYFFESSLTDWVLMNGEMIQRVHSDTHPLLEDLRSSGNAGLVLFSTGTTGRPKAILHDMTHFLARYETPRPTLQTLSFLMFDHIGGINTLLHTLFNGGTVITPRSRSINDVLETVARYKVEVLPTTPTFLRMLLMSGRVPDDIPASLKVVTYGTERMDESTLAAMCRLLPSIDFRQTFGMSELGILRVKSKARDSLFMRIGGEGVQIRIREGLLDIRSETRMLGYLNAPSPFMEGDWYPTGDLVEVDGDYIKIVGRNTEVVNVGGLKFMSSEVERVILEFPGVELVKVSARPNPLTGQHVEATIQVLASVNLDQQALRGFLEARLPQHMIPRRISTSVVEVSHRYKRL